MKGSLLSMTYPGSGEVFTKEKFDLYSKKLTVLLAFAVPISPVATHVVLAALLLCWIASNNIQEKLTLMRRNPVACIAVLLMGMFLLGALYSAGNIKDIAQQLKKMSKLLYIPLIVVTMQEAKWRRLMMNAFVFAMLVTLFLSILKVYAGLPITNQFTTACVFRDHIYTNLMMAFASFILGHYWLSAKDFKVKAIIFLLLCLLAYYILVMSDGRAGYIIYAMSWALLCLQRLPWRWLLVGIVALLCLFGFALTRSTHIQSRTLEAMQNYEAFQAGNANTSLGARLQYLSQTWQLSKKRFWLGWGTGSFKKIYHQHAMDENLIITQNPHNEYLNVFFQLGIVGLITLLGFFGVILKYSFYLSVPEQWYVQGLLMAMVVGCIANSWLMDFTSGNFFVILTACCFGALNTKENYG